MLRWAGDAQLLGFAIDNVLSQNWIKLAKLKTTRIVAAVLFRQVHVRAFCAAHFDYDARALLRNNLPPFLPSHNQVGADNLCGEFNFIR